MNRRTTWVVTTPAAARSPRTESRPFVSLLSDFGSRDPSAAICRAVVLSIAPDALVVDITHKVEKYNIRHGALMLWSALPYLPIGAHMAVVDPGVGTTRRPIVIETARGDYLVGPDNGLLLPGADRLGGMVRVHAIDNTQYRLPIISATFHGRDLFAPTAAHLAAGVPLDAIGPALDPHSLVGIDWPPVVVRGDELETTVIYHDTFGNLKLAGLTADLQAALESLELRRAARGQARPRPAAEAQAGLGADIRCCRAGRPAAVRGLIRSAVHCTEPGQRGQNPGGRGRHAGHDQPRTGYRAPRCGTARGGPASRERSRKSRGGSAGRVGGLGQLESGGLGWLEVVGQAPSLRQPSQFGRGRRACLHSMPGLRR